MLLNLAELGTKEFKQLEDIYRELWWKDAKLSSLTPPEQWVKVFTEFVKRQEARSAAKTIVRN